MICKGLYILIPMRWLLYTGYIKTLISWVYLHNHLMGDFRLWIWSQPGSDDDGFRPTMDVDPVAGLFALEVLCHHILQVGETRVSPLFYIGVYSSSKKEISFFSNGAWLPGEVDWWLIHQNIEAFTEGPVSCKSCWIFRFRGLWNVGPVGDSLELKQWISNYS